MAPNRRPVRVSLSLLLAAVVTLHAFAGRGDLFYAELTLCNGLTSDRNPNDSILDIEITPFHGATRYVSVAFGRCATVESLDIGAALGKVRVHLFTTDRVLEGESYMPVLSEARRNYAVAYTSGMRSIDLAAPSSHFDKVTSGDVRFVWLNLCTLCAGDASAWVGQGYTTKIPDKGPLSYGADNPVERQQTPPGPFGTIGDTALFTEYAEGSSRPGERWGELYFPWRREQYEGREPLSVLLAPNLTMAVLHDQQPVVFGKCAAAHNCVTQRPRS